MEYYVKSVIPIIESNYDKFTTTEKTIADFFIHNQKKMDFSVNHIAELFHQNLFPRDSSYQKRRYPDLRRNADIADTENSSISMKRHL